LKGSQAVVNMTDAVVAGFGGIVHAGDEVIAMFQRLTSAGHAQAATINKSQMHGQSYHPYIPGAFGGVK
jgi:hypothetical protein